MASQALHRIFNFLLAISIALSISSTSHATINYAIQGCNHDASVKIILLGIDAPCNDAESIKQATVLTAFSQSEPNARWLIEKSTSHKIATTQPGKHPLREQLLPHYSYAYDNLAQAVLDYGSTLRNNSASRTTSTGLVNALAISYSEKSFRPTSAQVSALDLFLDATESQYSDIISFDNRATYLPVRALLSGYINFPSKRLPELTRLMALSSGYYHQLSMMTMFDVAAENICELKNKLTKLRLNKKLKHIINEKIKRINKNFDHAFSELKTYNLNNSTMDFLTIYTRPADLTDGEAEDSDDTENREETVDAGNNRGKKRHHFEIAAEIIQQNSDTKFFTKIKSTELIELFDTVFNHQLELALLLEFLEVQQELMVMQKADEPIVVTADRNRTLWLQGVLESIGYHFDEDGADKENLPTDPAYWTAELELLLL